MSKLVQKCPNLSNKNLFLDLSKLKKSKNRKNLNIDIFLLLKSKNSFFSLNSKIEKI